jgi:hypothetical protein
MIQISPQEYGILKKKAKYMKNISHLEFFSGVPEMTKTKGLKF